MYILQIPNVMDVCSICSNPAAFIMSMNFSGAGNFNSRFGNLVPTNGHHPFGYVHSDNLAACSQFLCNFYCEISSSASDIQHLQWIMRVNNLAHGLFPPPFVYIE